MQSTELRGRDWALVIVLTMLLMGGLFAWMDHESRTTTYLSLTGTITGDPVGKNTTLTLDPSEAFDERTGGRAVVRVVRCGRGDQVREFRFEPGATDVRLTEQTANTVVGARCVVSARGQTTTVTASDGALARPNRRTCRLRHLPCANG